MIQTDILIVYLLNWLFSLNLKFLIFWHSWNTYTCCIYEAAESRVTKLSWGWEVIKENYSETQSFLTAGQTQNCWWNQHSSTVCSSSAYHDSKLCSPQNIFWLFLNTLRILIYQHLSSHGDVLTLQFQSANFEFEKSTFW